MSKRTHKLGFSAVILLFLCSGCRAFSIHQELSAVKISALKQIGEYYKQSVNNSVDPCEAYGDYICGNMSKYKIRLNRELENYVVLHEEDKKEILKKYLPDRKHMSAAELKMQNFLTSCENKHKDHHAIKQFAKSNFPNWIGGWPAFDSEWNSNKYDLVSAIGEFQYFGSLVINIKTALEENYGNIIPKLQSQRIPLLMSINKEEDEEKAERDLLKKFDVPNVDEVMSDIQLFKKEYRNAISFDTSGEPEEMTYAVLKTRFPQFDWDKFFEIILGKGLDDATPLFVQNLDELKKLYNAVEAMEPRVVVNYLFLLFIERLDSELENNVSCYADDRLFVHFDRVISRLVVSNLYNSEFKAYIMDMVRAVVETSFDYEPNYEGETSDEIMTKIDNFVENQYLPSLTEEKVIESYADVQIDPENYYGNFLQLIRYDTKERIQSYFQEFHIAASLSNVFIKTVYDYYRKPSPIIYDLIAGRFLFEIWSPFRQMNSTETLSDVLTKYAQNYVKAFDKWAEKNHEVVAKEDAILGQFNLTNKKLVFALALLAADVCVDPYDAGSSLVLEYTKVAFRNEEYYAKEFNCPLGSAMNPEI